MLYNKKYKLKNGKNVIVRNAVVSEAEAVAKNANLVRGETRFLGYMAKERQFTIEDEIQYIEKMNAAPHSVFLVTEYEGEIVGTAQLRQISSYQWQKHRCDLGITISKKFWGLGIGGKVMQSLIDCAKKLKYEQIELYVDSTNINAIKLYESFGFNSFGIIKNAMRFSSKEYSDSVIMIKFLTEKTND